MKHSRKRTRLFSIEKMESRSLLATITVGTLVDENDGNFAANDLSLREAIFQADQTNAADLINFNPALTGTITLNGTELQIKKDTKINGLGAHKITIDANDLSRVFHIGTGTGTKPVVEIANLTITGGNAVDGGGIFNQGDLTLRKVHITGNEASYGGGILSGSHVSTESNNFKLSIADSTISANHSTYSGGGIMAGAGTSTGIVNTTVSSNNSGGAGAGMHHIGAVAKIANSTIAYNQANLEGNGTGGGLNAFRTTLHNTIVVQNKRMQNGSSVSDDIAQNMAVGSANNIVGNAASAGGLQNGVGGNIVGVNGSGTIAEGAVISIALGINGGLTPTHSLTTGSLAIDKGSNSKAITLEGTPLTVDQRGQLRIEDGDSNASAITDVGAYEAIRPVLNNLGTPATHTEGQSAVVITSTIELTDEGTDFAGGTLTVKITNSPTSGDRLFIRNGGTAAGKIGVSGANITFGGVLMGTFTGGDGVNPLVVSLNSVANTIATRSLLRNIMYKTLSDNPSPIPRAISFQLADGDGGMSIPYSKNVNVVPVNDAPTLTNISGTIDYKLNGTQIALVTNTANVIDPDSTNFDGGKLTVHIGTGSEASNRMFLSTTFTLSGQTVLRSGVVIGTLNTNAGVGTTDPEITCNSSASRTTVVELLRALRFKTIGQTATTGARLVTLILTDGDGGTSATASRTVNVIP